jgi:hypothetical protein
VTFALDGSLVATGALAGDVVTGVEGVLGSGGGDVLTGSAGAVMS